MYFKIFANKSEESLAIAINEFLNTLTNHTIKIHFSCSSSSSTNRGNIVYSALILVNG